LVRGRRRDGSAGTGLVSARSSWDMGSLHGPSSSGGAIARSTLRHMR
jgi:hypothetical protein